MKISEQQAGDIKILNLEGNLIGGPEAVSLNETVNRFLDQGAHKVVIDLGNVERMNSSGLGILIKALTTFKSNGGTLKLANVNEKIENLLVITKLDSVFESFDSVAAAVNSF
ncbi:MAG TPA: anti-sigma factor antagonist [Caldithrix sp.]|nr:anti-sigma factor antagonist [Caldithrix sp.]